MALASGLCVPAGACAALGVALCVGVQPALAAEASQPFTVSVGSGKVGTDGTVTLPVTMENCPGVAAFRFFIEYDVANYTLTAITRSSGGPSGMLNNLGSEESGGLGVVTWYAMKDMVFSGEVFTLTLKAKEGCSAKTSEVVLSSKSGDVCNYALEDVAVTYASGTISNPNASEGSSGSEGESGSNPGSTPSGGESGGSTSGGSGSTGGGASGGGTPSVPAPGGGESGTPEPSDPGADESVPSSIVVSKITYKPSSSGAKTVALSKVPASATKLTVPATIKIGGVTYKVTAIAASAFAGSKAKTLILGANVTSIGAKAFANCKNLTSLTLGAGVKSIGAKALYGCKKLTTVKVNSSKLTKATITNLLKGTQVKTIKCGTKISKKVKATYLKWAKAAKKSAVVK